MSIVQISKKEKSLDEEWSDLVFDIKKSIKYHTYRSIFFKKLRGFALYIIFIFSILSLLVSCIGLFLFTSSIAQTSLESILINISMYSFICSMISSCMVYMLSIEIDRYNDLISVFNLLESQMSAVVLKTPKNLQKFIKRFYDITIQEPPIKSVLNSYCHNELCKTLGMDKKHFIKISFIQVMFMQWIDIFPSKMRTYGNIGSV